MLPMRSSLFLGGGGVEVGNHLKSNVKSQAQVSTKAYFLFTGNVRGANIQVKFNIRNAKMYLTPPSPPQPQCDQSWVLHLNTRCSGIIGEVNS